ncbi:MAG: two component transcriptional regulator, LuxR family [Conexibacter sp.]|nr:two component transcriptional regulator, LuxR family [Conexibacter sp.]
MTFVEHSSDAFDLTPSLAGDVAASTAAAALSVVVIDPHAAVREGLPLLLDREGIDVVASASPDEAAETLIGRHEPDIALVSLEEGDRAGTVLLQRLVRRGLRTAIVLYSDEDDGEQAARAMHSGAAGVVAKHRTVAELAGALRTIAAGGLWFNEPEATAGGALRPEPALVLSRGNRRRTATLSSSELRVLALVAEGRSTDSMAGTLSLSPHTVRTHLRNVMRKLEASSRAHAVAIAIRESAIQA